MTIHADPAALAQSPKIPQGRYPGEPKLTFGKKKSGTMLTAVFQSSAIVATSLLLLACGVPEHMHVTEGNAPQNIDEDVRFRTTYYFRTFDYCWMEDKDNYRQIIPETDTLYRYRMTGKASSLFSEIKFESGTLHKNIIDTFGNDVVYNQDINGFIVRNAADAKQEAEAAAAARMRREQQRAAAGQLKALVDQHVRLFGTDGKGTGASADVKMAMETAMANLASASAGIPAPLSTEQKAVIDGITAEIKKIDARQGDVAEQIKKLNEALIGQQNVTSDNPCAPRANRSKGFQIMGPEGMRTFNQDERLILAMFTSARPLIQTLQEYSGRILKSQSDPIDMLVPLARENARIVEARRTLGQVEKGVTAASLVDGVGAIFESPALVLGGE